MSFEFNSVRGALGHGFDTLIDVRSPAEFQEDHVPGAISLPVLSNEERARVGTVYVQQDPFLARKIGAALVARNAAAHIEGPLSDKDGGWRPLVYCWRGGQRSGSFATILKNIGWRADTVQGGYKSWRKLVATSLYDEPLAHRLVLLDGNTGTAKTAILEHLTARGVQVLDLEALAAHRGSIFGDLGAPQPAQKGFESALATALAGFDPIRPVVVEAESARIGDIRLPPSLWKAMVSAPRLGVSAPNSARASYLAAMYQEQVTDPEWLSARLDGLTYFLGKARCAELLGLAHDGEYEQLAGHLIEDHYDPTYNRARRSPPLRVFETESLDEDALQKLADRIARDPLISG